MITLIVIKNINEPKTHPLENEESYIVSTSEMEDSYELPRYARSLTNDIQEVLSCIGKRRVVNEIQPNSAYMYTLRVVQWVNKE